MLGDKKKGKPANLLETQVFFPFSSHQTYLETNSAKVHAQADSAAWA